MKSRLIAGITAVVLALLGAVMVFSYANGAEARAVERLEPKDVFVVREAVPAGTPVAELAAFLALDSLPAASVAPSALSSLDGSSELVTAVDLVPGEQLLAERLADPTTTAAVVPEGFHEISVIVDPQRVVGGKVTVGDVVGVFMSLPAGGIEERPDAQSTQLVLPNALVSGVQRAPVDIEQSDSELSEALPGGAVLVTLAVNAEAATRIVFASEFGTVWLSKATVADPGAPPLIIQDKELYR